MSQLDQLQAPDTDSFKLEPPKAVTAVAPAESQGRVPLKPEVVTALDQQVAKLTEDLLNTDVNSDLFRERIRAIGVLGNAETRAASSVSGRLVERPLKAIKGTDGGGIVSSGLIELRRQVESLDPSKHDLMSPRKLLGFIPWGNKIQNYFDEYASAQTHIQSILDSLNRGQDELMRDNAAIEEEKLNLWELMKKTEQILHVCAKLDEELSRRIADLRPVDSVKAKIIEEEALFEVRQKRTDLLTQMAVNLQGYMAFGMIQKNNRELIKGVERASTTTVSALRVAVAVSSALGNQKLVLDQINAVNATTGNLIEATSAMLKDNSIQIAQQAGNAMVPVEQLQKAFANIYATMDAMSDFRSKAVEAMGQTVQALETETKKAKDYLDRNRSRIAGEALAASANGVANRTAGGEDVVQII